MIIQEIPNLNKKASYNFDSSNLYAFLYNSLLFISYPLEFLFICDCFEDETWYLMITDPQFVHFHYSSNLFVCSQSRSLCFDPHSFSFHTIEQDFSKYLLLLSSNINNQYLQINLLTNQINEKFDPNQQDLRIKKWRFIAHLAAFHFSKQQRNIILKYVISLKDPFSLLYFLAEFLSSKTFKSLSNFPSILLRFISPHSQIIFSENHIINENEFRSSIFPYLFEIQNENETNFTNKKNFNLFWKSSTIASLLYFNIETKISRTKIQFPSHFFPYFNFNPLSMDQKKILKEIPINIIKEFIGKFISKIQTIPKKNLLNTSLDEQFLFLLVHFILAKEIHFPFSNEQIQKLIFLSKQFCSPTLLRYLTINYYNNKELLNFLAKNDSIEENENIINNHFTDDEGIEINDYYDISLNDLPKPIENEQIFEPFLRYIKSNPKLTTSIQKSDYSLSNLQYLYCS